MKKSLKKHAKVLVLNEETRLLRALEEETVRAYPEIQFYSAATYLDGLQLLLSLTFDLVVSEIEKEPGLSLMDVIISRRFPLLAMLDGGESVNLTKGLKNLDRCTAATQKDSQELITNLLRALGQECSPYWKRILARFAKFPIWMVRLSKKNLSGYSFEEQYLFY